MRSNRRRSEYGAEAVPGTTAEAEAEQLCGGRRDFHNGVAASLRTRHQTGGLIKPGLKTRLYAL